MQGEELPGRWPHVAAALAAGTISVDAARVIVDALGSTARRAVPEELEAAEAALVDSAASTSPDLLRVQAEVWQARLDPDGAKPAEDAAHRNRGVKVGIEGPDGITRSVLLTATEETALLRAIFAANRRGCSGSGNRPRTATTTPNGMRSARTAPKPSTTTTRCSPSSEPASASTPPARGRVRSRRS